MLHKEVLSFLRNLWKSRITRCLISVVVLPLVITAMGFIIDPAGVNLFSFCLTLSVVWALHLVVFSAVGRPWASWLITAVVVMIPVLINYFKIAINGLPLVLSDLSFGKNATELAEFAAPQLRLSPELIGVFIAFCIITYLLIYVRKALIPSVRLRLASGCAGVLLAVMLCVPAIGSALAGVGGSASLASEDLVIKHGAIAGLYCSASYDKVREPVTREALGVIREEDTSGEKPFPEVKPTVIYLMSESFFDVDRLPGVEFSRDPIENFHKLRQDYSSGSFVSYTYCGGTGFVEMEVLTGLSNHFLNNAHTLDSLPAETYSHMPCIGDIYEKNGYTTAFVHSHTGDLYNRPAIYSAFGFDDIRFRDSFTAEKVYSGGYVSDMTLTNEIISIYEQKGDKPLMLFAVSMENHQPYTPYKYREKSNIEIVAERLTPKEGEVFESYIHGLENADKALGELVEYFSDTEEPVVIVFWGDHLPNLSLPGGTNVYKELGYTSEAESYKLHSGELMDMVTTDYVIWDNFGMKKTRKSVGSTSFGVRVADMLGLEMTDYYEWFSANVMDRYLMCRPRLYAVSGKEVYDSVPPKYAGLMEDYAAVIYDIVYGGNTLFCNYRK